MIELYEEYSKMNAGLSVGDKMFADLRFQEALCGNAGDRIQAAESGRPGLPPRPIRGRTILLKTFGRPYHGTVGVANRMRSQNDGHTEAIFVEDGNVQDGSFTIAEGHI